MAESDTALATAESTELVTVPDERLSPTTRAQELVVMLGIYLGLLLPATFVGIGAQFLVLVGAMIYVIRRRRRWYRAVAQQRDIQIALNDGDVAQAERIGRALVMDGNRYSLAHACSVGAWGSIEVHRGNPQRAVEIMERVLATGRFTGRIGKVLEAWRYVAALAYAHAIAGDVEAAKRRLAEVDAVVEDNRRGMLLTIRAYIGCRAGEAESVVKLFDAQWRAAETQLTVGGARTARMIEAFALEQMQGDGYRSAITDRRQRALDRASEAPPGAFDYLAVCWPELQDFLARNGLAASQPASSSASS
ncbi:MAG: hypothetical protein AAF721_27285 [Myxococcota bacterium]